MQSITEEVVIANTGRSFGEGGAGWGRGEGKATLHSTGEDPHADAEVIVKQRSHRYLYPDD